MKGQLNIDIHFITGHQRERLHKNKNDCILGKNINKQIRYEPIHENV